MKKKKQRSYLPTCPFANSMAKIRINSKFPIGATLARGWKLQLEKSPSLILGKGFENGADGRRIHPF
jgi:hypothetical protein